MKRVAQIILFVSVCLLTGAVGSFATRESLNTWYTDLAKPSFAPPDWAFGVVWPILYVLMGISVLMIWRKGTGDRQVRVALGAKIFLSVLQCIPVSPRSLSENLHVGYF